MNNTALAYSFSESDCPGCRQESRLVVLQSGIGLESRLKSIFAGLGLEQKRLGLETAGLGLETDGLRLGLGKICNQVHFQFSLGSFAEFCLGRMTFCQPVSYPQPQISVTYLQQN